MAVMTERDTVLRSMHDVGLAEWFGGSLMGVVGLNGAAANVPDPTERLRVSSIGWDRWAPLNLAGIAAHLIGAAGILANERRRVATQKGVAGMSTVKTTLTVAALAATAYSRMLGRKLEKAGRVPVEGVTEPAPDTPEEIRAAQRRQKLMQWAVPALTGGLIVITAFAGEQQKPSQGADGILGRIGSALSPGTMTRGMMMAKMR